MLKKKHFNCNKMFPLKNIYNSFYRVERLAEETFNVGEIFRRKILMEKMFNKGKRLREETLNG